MSIGTTRPVRPGWRAPRRTTSGRSAVSARMPSISAASCALAAQKSNRASASSVSRSGSALAATSADSSSRIRSISSLLGGLRLAPGVAELDGDERLDEQRLAAARRVVDDALDPAPRLGLDRDDVAAVAERDDRLLERAAELRPDERVEPPAEPVVGDADGRPQAAEPRRRRVEQLAGRIEAAGERASAAPAAGGARGRARGGAAGARRRATSASRAVASSVSAISRNWAGSSRPPRAARSTAGPMSWAAPIADARPLGRAAPAPGRSRRGRGRRATGSSDGSRASASRRDGGNDVCSARRSRTSGNSRRAIERASISRSGGCAAARPGDGTGWPAIDEPPRHARSTARRRRRSRPAGVADDVARADRRPAGGSRRSGDAGSSRSQPGQRPVEPERGRDEARAAARPCAGQPPARRSAARRSAAARVGRRGARAASRARARASRRCPRSARRRGRAARPAGPRAR